MKKINIYLGVMLLVLVALPQSKVEAMCSVGEGVLAFGQTSLAIKNMQACLNDQGYTIPAGATGYYGVQTKIAVQKFYTDKLGLSNWHGLSVGPMGREKLTGASGSALPTISSPVSSSYKPAGSAENFKKYVAEFNNFNQRLAVPAMALDDSRGSAENSLSAPVPKRVSETTVQIAGVDEPDIVKTDGKNIFYSRNNWFGGIEPMPMVRMGGTQMMDKMIAPYPVNPGTTDVINAFPPIDLKVSGKIKETGDLLLDKSSNTLVVLSYPKIVAYNVANQTSPKKLWDLEIPQNSSIVSARLNDGKIYLVTETWVDNGNPCPVIPMAVERSLFVPCAEIYVPIKIEPVSHTYNIIAVDPAKGEVEKKLSFASDGGATTVMMSKDSVYLATRAYTEPTEVMLDVLSLVATKHLSQSAKDGINKIKGYDISLSGKLNEVSIIIQNELNKLDPNARLKAEANFNNDVASEMAKRQRDLETTRIARIDLDTLNIQATGAVPGSLLNQFSLDEYNGDLRVSTTVGGNNWFSWGQGGESVNDVYVLGADLKKKGEVLDLGKGERIFSTRFMGDQGYVVTFKQVDPFYVLDLANPSAPKLSGELKIPGYSSYLEKISDDLVLGVGRENNNVKVSLFDVSNASAPKEVAKYLLKDEWSEVENNHHAFMLDADNKTFFIPGGQGGYFFSYADNGLKLVSTVSQSGVTRAIYIDDYYYVVGNDAIKVLDLNTWKEVGKLGLK
jgi:inhibitor of cysteine peptidase